MVGQQGKVANGTPDWRLFVTERASSVLTFDELQPRFLSHIEKTRPASLIDARSVYENHIQSAFGALTVAELLPEHVEAWLQAMRARKPKPYAEQTIGKHLYWLSSVIEYAREQGMVDRNVTRLVRKRHRPGRKSVNAAAVAESVLSPAAARELIHSPLIPFERRALWSTLLLTGLRIGEASGLRWADWDPSTRPLGSLRIHQQWSTKRRELGPTKDKTDKILPVHQTLHAMLTEGRRWFESHYLRQPFADDPLLSWPKAWREIGQWNERTALRYWKDDLAAVDLGRKVETLHLTRHTFISLLLRAGAPEMHIRALTHVSTAHDRRDAFSRYAHLDFATLCGSVELLKI